MPIPSFAKIIYGVLAADRASGAISWRTCSLPSCAAKYVSFPQEMEAAIAFTIHEQLLDLRAAAVHSASDDVESISKDKLGPRLSSVQPVDQYEFNARDWRDHRCATLP